MKHKSLLSLFVAVLAFMFVALVHQASIGNSGGAQAGHSGSPADGKTCIQCHNTSAVPLPNLISSTIPTQGYTPGATYTITAAVGQTGINKYGFQVSPQSANGTYLGNLVVTNPSQSKIIGTKYITHTIGGVSGIGFKAWTFDWIAPASGTGDVTFYGAFVYANGNNNSSGDMVRTSTYTVSENLSTGIESASSGLSFNLYPNPFQNQATISFSTNIEDLSDISIYNLLGKVLSPAQYTLRQINSKEVLLNAHAIPAGVYFIKVVQENKSYSKKIILL
ncbi:MAG TPA: T9SS type A sorting domain-containing protein [Bacteroidia bacterium]|nr:T9SS type A sorting domain-containing protein [Bacteroidia bacterium]HNT80827.1 T9SS type A sorting domain-containing protein [Bacteroidia bacterium]